MKAILIIILTLISIIEMASAQVAVDWNIKRLEDKLRNEIETGVKEYLGPDKKFKVYVQVSGKTKTEEKKAVDIKDGEFGYLSMADSYQDVKVSEKVFVNSVSADIFVYEQINAAISGNIRKIASGAMKGYQNTIKLNVMPSPPPKIVEEKKEAPKPEVKPEPEPVKEPPFDLSKFLIAHASDVFKMVSGIFIGFFCLVGLFLLAKAIITAFKSIGDAMKSSTEKITNQQQLKKESDDEKQKTEEEKASRQKREEVFDNQLEIQFNRNIEIVKSCLRTSPYVFKQVLKRSDENLRGLKTLLPVVVECSTKLKEAVSPDLWKKLETVKGIEEGMFNRWLNGFAEDLSVAQMTENGYFSYVVDHSLMEQVYSSKFSHLVQASMQVNSGILYKFILDFLPHEESISLMNNFDEATWKLILTERYVSASGLSGDIEKMLQIRDEYLEKEKHEINDHGLARILSNPMTLFLQSKTFEESESFFDILLTSAPDLANLLKSKFWTPRILFRIPEHYLSEKFNSYSVEIRAYILLSVQENVRNYLLGFIPEGKVMTIVTDQYNRDVGNTDERHKEKCNKAIKDLLETLKADSIAGLFTLKEEAEVEVIVAPADAEVFKVKAMEADDPMDTLPTIPEFPELIDGDDLGAVPEIAGDSSKKEAA